ncbi:uncharacterized protein LOC142986982 [Anticarsia gemmatalis]|uniref:uncharacterized protein LOC142986982 n=1 Tax=Anticarsia gemmatalis TaxID=129554 RepID=UPI003F769EF3
MADTAVAAEAPAPATPAKKQARQAGGAKKPKAKPTHPKTSEMVNNAIKEMKERSGSSLQAIKKYIAAQYKVDAEKLAPFIRKYLKSAVESGALIQTKGKGASGSFKLESKSAAAKKPSASAGAGKAAAGKGAAAASKAGKKATASAAGAKSKKAAAASASASASPSKAKASAAAKDKKAAAAAKKKPAAKKAAAPAKAKGGAAPKAKKTAKPPTKKPKAPKPKKAAATPKSKPAAKKAAAAKNSGRDARRSSLRRSSSASVYIHSPTATEMPRIPPPAPPSARKPTRPQPAQSPGVEKRAPTRSSGNARAILDRVLASGQAVKARPQSSPRSPPRSPTPTPTPTPRAPAPGAGEAYFAPSPRSTPTTPTPASVSAQGHHADTAWPPPSPAHAVSPLPRRDPRIREAPPQAAPRSPAPPPASPPDDFTSPPAPEKRVAYFITPPSVPSAQAATQNADRSSPMDVAGPSYAAMASAAAPTVTAALKSAAGTSNAAAATAATAAASSEKPTTPRYPPLVVEALPDWPTHFRALKELLGHAPNGRPFGKGVRFLPKSAEEYRIIQRYLTTLATKENLSWFSYSLPEERSLKVAIRGLPVGTPPELIAEELTARGFTPEHVRPIQARQGRPGCLYFAQLARTRDAVPGIYEVTELLYMPGVKIEAWRGKRGPAQCHRCQGFRHSSHNCHRRLACVRCGEEHAARDCARPREEPPTCANCGGAHTANNIACPAFKREARNKKAGTVARTSAPSARKIPAADLREDNAPGSLMAAANAATAPSGPSRRRRRKRGAKKPHAAPQQAPSSAQPAPASQRPPAQQKQQQQQQQQQDHQQQQKQMKRRPEPEDSHQPQPQRRAATVPGTGALDPDMAAVIGMLQRVLAALELIAANTGPTPPAPS